MADRRIAAEALRLGVLGFVGLLILSPYIWMLAASVKPLDELFRASLSLWPERFHGLENYGRVFAEVPAWKASASADPARTSRVVEVPAPPASPRTIAAARVARRELREGLRGVIASGPP